MFKIRGQDGSGKIQRRTDGLHKRPEEGYRKTDVLCDETLGRIEFGGRYGFTDQLSAYGWANYTFGSDYDATTVGLGLNYAF